MSDSDSTGLTNARHVHRRPAASTRPRGGALSASALRGLVGPLVVADADGVIVDATTEAAALFETGGRSLLGRPLEGLFDPSALPIARDELSRARHEPRSFRSRLERDGQVPLEAEVRLVAEGGDGDDDPRMYVAFRDVTEARETERQLSELTTSFERRLGERTAELTVLSDELEHRWTFLQTIIQHLPLGLVIVDPNRRVTMANELARTVTGLDPGIRVDARARGGADVDGPRTYQLLVRALAGETFTGERLTLRHEHGLGTVLDVNVAPIRGADGAVVAAVGLFQDVTETEVRRRAAADFISNAAHELRTPLAAIGSAVEVLQAGAKLTAEDRDRFLGHIGRETARLVRLTRALLVLARAQSGVEAPRLELVEVQPLLREVASGLRAGRGVRVLVRASPDAAVLANRGLLEQALSALAANAARYTTSGRVTLSASRRGDKVSLRVRDTGRGMTAAQLAAAGDRFAPVTNPDGGFSLGLSIAREAVAALGSTLRLESVQGQGTTATITLPAARLVMPS